MNNGDSTCNMRWKSGQSDNVKTCLFGSNEGRRYRVSPNLPTRFRPTDVIEFGADKKVWCWPHMSPHPNMSGLFIHLGVHLRRLFFVLRQWNILPRRRKRTEMNFCKQYSSSGWRKGTCTGFDCGSVKQPAEILTTAYLCVNPNVWLLGFCDHN